MIRRSGADRPLEFVIPSEDTYTDVSVQKVDLRRGTVTSIPVQCRGRWWNNAGPPRPTGLGIYSAPDHHTRSNPSQRLDAPLPDATRNLTADPIPALIRQLAIPASVGMFFNTMYNVVDTYYAGQLSTDALAALSLTFPIYFTLLAMGMGFSTGRHGPDRQRPGPQRPCRGRPDGQPGFGPEHPAGRCGHDHGLPGRAFAFPYAGRPARNTSTCACSTSM